MPLPSHSSRHAARPRRTVSRNPRAAALPGALLLGASLLSAFPGSASPAEPRPSHPYDDDRHYFFSKSATEDARSVAESAFPESSSVTEQDPSQWPDKDISPDFPELQVFDQVDPKKSLASVRQAREFYLQAQKVVEAGEKEATALAAKSETAKLQHEWQRRERQQHVTSQQRLIRLRVRRKAIAFTVRSLQTLDEVQNPGVLASSYFVELKAKAVRQYVRLQLSTGSISGCQEMIQVYFDLKPEHKSEPEPYRVLAIIYKKLENMARETKVERDYVEYRRLKNENLLKYAELAFGKTSKQYEMLQDQIRYDLMEHMP